MDRDASTKARNKKNGGNKRKKQTGLFKRGMKEKQLTIVVCNSMLVTETQGMSDLQLPLPQESSFEEAVMTQMTSARQSLSAGAKVPRPISMDLPAVVSTLDQLQHAAGGQV